MTYLLLYPLMMFPFCLSVNTVSLTLPLKAKASGKPLEPRRNSICGPVAASKQALGATSHNMNHPPRTSHDSQEGGESRLRGRRRRKKRRARDQAEGVGTESGAAENSELTTSLSSQASPSASRVSFFSVVCHPYQELLGRLGSGREEVEREGEGRWEGVRYITATLALFPSIQRLNEGKREGEEQETVSSKNGWWK